ncbi:hypothetical protein PG994_005322 [Apiospora phragmitis]|uniref:DUF7136 domain-containing protein n=1 Tax=Apiospora phragmitis TaxID=2905665 RepID=A0ABR1VEG7_9PEZI
MRPIAPKAAVSHGEVTMALTGLVLLKIGKRVTGKKQKDGLGGSLQTFLQHPDRRLSTDGGPQQPCTNRISVWDAAPSVSEELPRPHAGARRPSHLAHFQPSATNPVLFPFLSPYYSNLVFRERPVSLCFAWRHSRCSSPPGLVGTYAMRWTFDYAHCTEDTVIWHTYANSTQWTIEDSAQDVNLVAATANKECSEKQGVVINVTDTLEAKGIWSS